MSTSLYEKLEKWSLSQSTTADDFIQSVVKTFYLKVMSDPRLSRFFENANLDALQRHQAAFMKGLFSGEVAGGFTSKEIYGIHQNLIRNMGL